MKHIGYYNDIEDIKAYANCSADKVVEDMLNGIGSFHFVNEDYDVAGDKDMASQMIGMVLPFLLVVLLFGLIFKLVSIEE